MSNKTDSHTVFYKKTLNPSEDGLQILTREWVSVHETPCFHYCVPKSEMRVIDFLNLSGESRMACAKRLRILKRISKTSSRFAFDTEQKALDHLKFLKAKQLAHMKRDMLFIEKMLSTTDEDLSKPVIPDTKDLVCDYFVFD